MDIFCHNNIQTNAASPQIVELLIYFPNTYGLLTLCSFNCELQGKESRRFHWSKSSDWTIFEKSEFMGLKTDY